MFQQLANALNLEVSAVEDFLFGDERVSKNESFLSSLISPHTTNIISLSFC